MKNTILGVITIALAMGTQYIDDATGQTPQIPPEEQPVVLTRGPVHEAFAQPVNLTDQTGFTAPEEPPPGITEVPPAEKPAGDQFAWIPGYWSWDSDRNGYIWVSGCWRAVPPGMSWVPGYWANTEEGWQWIAGFWSPVSNNEIFYLPAPPALTNIEPQGPAPSRDKIWVPSCWYWYDGQYIQRPGYWLVERADWVWVPSSYVWTPRGYVFAKGYWDYVLDRRGVLFAPVYFPGRIYERPGFFYALDIAIDIDYLEIDLFTRPRYRHYYFGDYYDNIYISQGIYPWFEFEQRHTWYDPIYVHARWRNRADGPQWAQHEKQEYNRRRSDTTLRPPRTYLDQEGMNYTPGSQRRPFVRAVPMSKIVTRKTATFKFEQIEPEAHWKLSRHSDNVHKFVEERNYWESRTAGRNPVMPARRRVPSTEVKEPASQAGRREPVMKPGSAPAERVGRREPQGSSRQGSTTSPAQKRPARVSTRDNVQNQPDKVKVRTPPVVGKEGVKKPPSRPVAERNDQRKKRN